MSASLRLRRWSSLVVAIALGASVAPAAAAAGPDPAGKERSTLLRREPHKPDNASIGQGYSHTRLHLKFAEGAAIRLRGGRFVSLGDDDVSGVQDVLRRYPGVRVERMFKRPEAALAAEKLRIERASLRQQADKNLYFRLVLPGKKKTDAVQLIDDLNALGIVEIAYAEPLPGPDPTMHGTTPSFVDEQTYREAAPDGIDADFANTVPGGTGANVRVIDVERGWNRTHEDLTKLAPASALVENGTADLLPGSRQHGTAVMGEIVGDDNGLGVIGIAHGAAAGITNAQTTGGYELENAIDVAHAALNDGDVILIEQQIAGPNGCDGNTQVGCVAVEWNQAYYDAIVAATSDGIIVVEAAGNGAQDLDDAGTYGSPFPDGRADSGAIIVGAGSSPDCDDSPHERLGFSNHGARVNVQGYGHCVVTTGYGDLQTDAVDDFWYTDTFGGTSSASPIVTGAAVLLSSVAQQQGDADGLSSTEARALLAINGTPQALGAGQLAGNIGPLPNLAAGLEAWLPDTDAGGPYATVEGTDVLLSGLGSTDPQGAALSYEWDLDDNGTFETAGAMPTFTEVGADGVRDVCLRVTDSGGATDVDCTTVTIENVAPTVSLATNAPEDEGSLVQVSGTVSDAGWEDPLDATIDWQDGSVQAIAGTEEHVRPDGTIEFTVAHRYGDNGIYPVEVCGEDDDTSTCQVIDVQIDNVAPTVTVDPAQVTAIAEGGSVDVRATFFDPGWLDTYSPSVDPGHADVQVDPAPAAQVTSEGGPGPDEGEITATLTYGDNGLFLVTTELTDDDDGADDASFVLSVANLDPSALIDRTSTLSINGVDTFVAEAGETLTFDGDSHDDGSDDLTLSWDWDDGLPAPDTTELFQANPPLPDGFPSPQVNARDVHSTQQHAFGDACLYDVAFRSGDDDMGSANDQVPVVIVGLADRVRSAGYWSHQFSGKGKLDFTDAELACYLAITGHMSSVFDELRDASTAAAARDVLDVSGTSAMSELLDRQLLAAWLNFSNGAIPLDTMVDTSGDGVPDATFADAVGSAETVRSDPAATRADLEHHKDALERINLMHG